MPSDHPVAFVSGPRQIERRLVELDLAEGLVELGLVRPRIDLEQQVFRLDVGAVLKVLF